MHRTDGAFPAARLPAPDVLRRRHIALMLLDQALAGLEDPHHLRARAATGHGRERLAFDDGTGDGYALVLGEDGALLCALAATGAALDGDAAAGLPAPLAAELPAAVPDGRRAVACFWHDGRGWAAVAAAAAAAVEAALGELLEPAGEAAYRLVRDHHDQPYLGMTAHRFAEAVEEEARVDADLLRTVGPVDGVDAILGHARALGLA